MENRLARIIVSVIFIGLLAGTLIASRRGMLSASPEGNANQKREAFEKYGFYLEIVNDDAGIDFRHTPFEVDAKVRNIERQISSMGAAVSVCDFDNDGWNDLYFTNSGIGSYNALYRNLGNGKFEDVALQAGLADVNKKGTGGSMGSIWGDFDNDGLDDLLLYKWGKPELFRNIDGKRFERVTDNSGLPAWVNANSAIWLDFNNDGLLDIFIGGYFHESLHLDSLNTTLIMPESFRYASNGGRNFLLKNTGNGKFADVTKEYGLLSTKWTLAAGAADFTGDNFPELFIANDYSIDELYINHDGKQFEERGRNAGVSHIPKSGMNASFGDIKNEGLLGIYTTNITEKGILIQGNNFWQPKTSGSSELSFMNLAQLAGIDNAGWSYGAQFGDLNNDGLIDLYVANGFISGKKNTSYWYEYSKVTGGNRNIIGDAKNWPDMEGKSQSGYQQDKIWVNTKDGLFDDATGKVNPVADFDGRSVAMADLWNRGVLDVIVANQNNKPLIYKNTLNRNNHWIEIDLQGSVSNADAVGAKVQLEWDGQTQTQVVTGGIGFSSQNQHRLHFGLGESTKVNRLTIFWPSGIVQVIEHPEIDKQLVIKETKEKN